jgi:serine/threonine protein kinase
MSRTSLFRRFQDFGTGRLPAGSELNNRRYLLMTTIGKGGMGAVYLALDTHRGNHQVAIKEMSQADLRDPKALHRARQSFQQEATMLRQLQHPGLPHAYTSFEEEGRSYLVMEYISGDTLSHTLQQRRNRFLPVSSVVEYGLQLSAVLAYLHTRPQPILYLDLKPPNILLRKNDGHRPALCANVPRTDR